MLTAMVSPRIKSTAGAAVSAEGFVSGEEEMTDAAAAGEEAAGTAEGAADGAGAPAVPAPAAPAPDADAPTAAAPISIVLLNLIPSRWASPRGVSVSMPENVPDAKGLSPIALLTAAIQESVSPCLNLSSTGNAQIMSRWPLGVEMMSFKPWSDSSRSSGYAPWREVTLNSWILGPSMRSRWFVSV